MPTFAYLAKEPAASLDPTAPTNWPSTWTWPGPPWPGGWPVIYLPNGNATSTLEIVVTAPSTISQGTPPTTVTMDIQILATHADTDQLNLHQVQVYAEMNAATVQVKAAVTDSYADQIYFYISNYTGTKYGISESVYFDLAVGDIGETVTVYVDTVSATGLDQTSYSIDATVGV